MSIKTSKRIALGVIAGLVFAPFAAIAPANADPLSAVVVKSANTNAAYTDATTPVTPGTTLTFDLIITTTGAAEDGDNGTSTYTVKAGTKDITSTCTFAAATVDKMTIAVTTAATGTFTYSFTDQVAAGSITLGTASCPTTIGGLYTVTSTGTAALAGGTVITPTATAPGTAKATGAVYVSGLNVTQGLTRNTTTGTASVGGNATMLYYPRYHTAITAFRIVSTGVGSIQSAPAPAAGARTFVNGENTASGVILTTATANAAGDEQTLVLTSAEAGVQTITVSTTDATTGVSSVVATGTITWGDAPSVSAAYSTAYIADGSATPTAATNLLGAVHPRTYSTVTGQGATILVTLRDASNEIITGKGLTASVTSGPGLLGIDTDETVIAAPAEGRSVSLTIAEAAGSDGISVVTVWADGTAGTSTITISSGTTVVATKTVIFHGTVASLSVVQNLSIARASATGATLGLASAEPAGTTAASTPAVIVTALDANGNIVPGATITAVSSDTAVISSATLVEDNGEEGDGPGNFNVSVVSAPAGVSGSTATVTFRTLVGAAVISSDPVTFTLGGGVATETITFDKATYLPGEAMVITRTAKDASGNPVFDGAAAPAVSFNKAVGGTTPGTNFYVGGVRATSATSPTVFAPVTFGEFTARATSGNAAATVITATASVPAPVVPVVAAPLEKPTLTVAKNGGRTYLSGVAIDGEGDIIIYVKKIGTSAWKERAKTLEVSAPGDFNGSIRSLKSNIVIRVKQEGTGLFSNQVIVLK
jgi:hypothetical protein